MENELKSKNEADFLLKLSELSNQYGIKISGCGCCGSPWLQTFDVPADSAKHGKYIKQVSDDEPNISFHLPSDV
jgi:hypothetical protein